MSACTVQCLLSYTRSLRRWRDIKSLISHDDVPLIWRRHIADSLQLVSILPSARRWLDIGSGAGFPSVVIASHYRNAIHAEVHCVESDKKKCAFLASTAREARLRLKLHACRVSEIDPLSLIPIDAVTARAFADVGKIVMIAKPYLEVGAIGLFHVGESYQITAQCNLSEYDCRLVSNVLNPNSSILVVRTHKSS
jgi:16S rRNA (guanine527-N7)-methyltransferase